MPSPNPESGVLRPASSQPQPTALAEVVSQLGGPTFPLCESPSLRLEKFVRVGGTIKKEEIAALVKCHDKNARRIPAVLPPNATSFTATLGARLIVNQAGGVLENAGLCLHRHFGDPYIPGSAVKGVARHAAWCEWHDEPDAEKKRQIAQQIVRVFGYPTGDQALDAFIEPDKQKRIATAGSVCFLPAVPAGKSALAVDIVNCHHADYYAGKQQDAYDNESPIPNFFPAVDTGSEFRFTLVPLNRQGEAHIVCVQQAKEWLIKALTVFGAGAKTAAGYGWFVYDAVAEERKRTLEAERQARAVAEAERKQLEEQRRLANAEQKARESQMTPEQRADAEVAGWSESAFTGKLQRFHDPKRGPSDQQKVAMIRAMRSERLPLWIAFKARAVRGDLANAANAVHKMCKDLGQGKMPS